ncbi:MAG TPA: universal stress protein [Flavobacteriaceae bacterium]|nr:universal stress protein [Flavobacteriaceae bacterium]
MRKNILLPTDFSDNAWSAAVYALKLYSEEECTFYFTHSIKMKLSTLPYISNKFLKIINESAMGELLELKEMAETANTNANHEFEIILSSDDLLTAIETSVNKHQIDLVVMGKKGATGAEELFFGSNTVNTIRKMRLCPILTVPEDYDFALPKQIAFPTDFNRHFREKELKPLKELADMNNAKIRILHINIEPKLNDIQEYNFTVLKDYLADYDHSFHWMPDYTKKANEINEFIKDLKIDVLVMVNYKHSVIENIVKEPVIKKMGKHPLIPFLVLPSRI